MGTQRKRVLGVLAGTDHSDEWFAAWVNSAEIVLAADAGADSCLRIGRYPDLVIGDLDSLRSTEHLNVQPVPDQDSSDADKLLAHARDHGVKEITLAGVEGDRLDHVFATMSSAVRSGLTVRFALRRGVAWVLRPGEHHFAPAIGTTLSLIPLTNCEGVGLSGVKWPLSVAPMSADGLISLSNVVTEKHVRVGLESGAMAIFLLHPSLEVPEWPDFGRPNPDEP